MKLKKILLEDILNESIEDAMAVKGTQYEIIKALDQRNILSTSEFITKMAKWFRNEIAKKIGRKVDVILQKYHRETSDNGEPTKDEKDFVVKLDDKFRERLATLLDDNKDLTIEELKKLIKKILLESIKEMLSSGEI